MGIGSLQRLIKDITPRLIEWRRHIHQHPELSFEERETARLVAEELAALGLDVKRPLETAVVADIQGGRPGRTVALRADMDALPVKEETGLPYASRRDGVMHACGHDGHVAMLLAAANILVSQARFMPGTVRLIFQPAEEQPPGGAERLVQAGVLDGVDAIAGLHLWADLPTGVVGLCDGPAMAYADEFSITVKGRGGHGSQPHRVVDPIVTAAQVVLNLQAIISRRVDPLQPAVLSIGAINAGRAFNVIPSQAVLSGTVRSLDGKVREMIFNEIKKTVHHTCSMAGAEGEVRIFGSYPVLVNDPRITGLARQVVREVLGPQGAVPYGPVLGGEDFSYYMEKVPGVYIFLGAGGHGNDEVYPHHHPRFDIDERALPFGVEILVRMALLLADADAAATYSRGEHC